MVLDQRPATAAWALALAVIVTAAGCKTAGECDNDGDCSGQGACMSGTCVARVGPEGYTVAVELEPPQESSAARRDYAAVSFTASAATLELDRAVAVHAVLVPAIAEPTDRRSSVEIVLSVPSTLTGRPDISLQGGGINPGPSLPYDTQLVVPERLLGSPARMRVLPDMPVDQLLCPWQLDVVVAANMTVALPGDLDTIRIEGKVVAPVTGAQVPSYEARLFAGSRLVSNVGRTDSSGKFMLRAQKQLLERRSDARIEITQADLGSPSTTLVLPFDEPTTTNLGELKLPFIPQAIPFVVPVYAAQTQGAELKAPVVGASVRFFTQVGGASSGEVHYQRTAQTGGEGTTTIPLLPGSGGDTRDYVVSVVPPASSVTGSLCVPSYAIGAALAMNRVTAAIFLPRKATLNGKIRRFDGGGAGRMNLRATRIDASFAPACGTTLASPPTETTADDAGNYQLRLDPGDYLLEIDPPPGGALPRHVLPLLTVTAPGTTLDVDLPDGVVVEGQVVAPEGAPVGQTRVRMFPSGVAGAMLGTAVAGSDGRFRVVLPRLPSARRLANGASAPRSEVDIGVGAP
jgi:hypothetical protein